VLSSCGLDGAGSNMIDMDFVAVLLGLVMFAVLIGLIHGIDRI
jgi:hypothetical protein